MNSAMNREIPMLTPDYGELLDLTRALIELNTVNPPGNEQVAAELVLEYARRWGLQGELLPLGPDRANVLLTLPGQGTAPALLYCGHFDTVPLGEAAWTHPPHGAHVDADGMLWGRGSVDMKGGVAAMLLGMATLARAGISLPGDVRFLGTIGEEVDCAGASAALTSGVMDGVGQLVIAEPTDLALVVAHKGALFLEFTTLGRSAHGAMPEQGVNAIVQMTRLLARLQAFDFGLLNFGGSAHPLLGRPTLNIGTIAGGSVVNLVPDRCTVQVDVRTVPGLDHPDLLKRLEALLDELRSTMPDFRAEWRLTGDYPAVGTDPNCKLVQVAGRVLEGVTGRAPSITAVSYFSDGSVLQPATGVPTLLCGPGDPNLAHQTDERLSVRALEQAADFFTRLPPQFFAQEPS
jgi:succinyl-diaminopimelate desuccinylase